MSVVELVLFFLAIVGGMAFGISIGWELRGYRDQGGRGARGRDGIAQPPQPTDDPIGAKT